MFKRLFGALVALVLIFVLALTFSSRITSTKQALADTDNFELTGYGWSSNVGWFNFSGLAANGNPFGVKINKSSGYFSGHAWSNSVGWVDFAPASPYPGLPNNSAKIAVSGGSIDEGATATGWARACSVFASGCSGALKADSERGGWDGWIKMSGTTSNGSGSYGVKKVTVGSDGKLAGFAWGGDNIGWLWFGPNASDCPSGGTGYNAGANSNLATVGAGGGGVGGAGGGGSSNPLCSCPPGQDRCDGVSVDNFNVSCSAFPANPQPGQLVTWTANTTGGSASDYCWGSTCNPSPFGSDPGDVTGTGYQVTTDTTGLTAGTLISAKVQATKQGSSTTDTATCTANVEQAAPPECNNGVDQDDAVEPEDILVDGADPGCHTDGDANNPDSWDQNGISEIDVTSGGQLNIIQGGVIKITDQGLSESAISSPQSVLSYTGGPVTLRVQSITSRDHNIPPDVKSLLDNSILDPNVSPNQQLPKCYLGTEPFSSRTDPALLTTCASTSLTLNGNSPVYFVIEIYRPVKAIKDNSPYLITIGDAGSGVIMNPGPIFFQYLVGQVLPF